MATLLNLHPQDILFKHIFTYLTAADIWSLRRVCKDLHELCWDYFLHVLVSLTVSLSTGQNNIEVGAGSRILFNSEKIRDLEIIQFSYSDLDNCFLKVLSSLTKGPSFLRKFSLRLVNLSSMLPVLDSLSLKLCQLTRLELYGTIVKESSVEQILTQLLRHCRGLKELSMNNITFNRGSSLPVSSLSSLRYFNVSFSMCHLCIYL